MRKIFLAIVMSAGLLASLWPAAAKDAQGQQKSARQLSPEEIIKQFTTKESELREVWKEYSYQQESKIQVLGPANTISGEFYQVSDFVFNDAGKRIQRIIKAPPSVLEQSGILTQEDKNALTNLQPFALTAEDLPNYMLSYVGKEKVDELNCHVFEVIPRVMSNQRELRRMKDQKQEGKFFQGRIYVDDEDLQIVKTFGKVVPEFKQRFPRFETYRENIDGRYWFPTYTFGDDKLEFPDGGTLHVRMVIKYKNYRQFQSDVKITGVEEVEPEAKPEEKAKTGEVKKDEPKKEDPKKEDPKKEDPKKPQRPKP